MLIDVEAQECWSAKPGTIIAGRYDVVRPLGRGAYGEVYEAIDTLLGSARAAVKLFPGLVRTDRTAAKRFGDEVLAMARVEHPNVVRFFDVIDDGRSIGYSMECVEGAPLSSLRDELVPFGFGEVHYVLGNICRGVQAMHDRGLVHRDLKPENVMLTETGGVKITDFGLAHLFGAHGRALPPTDDPGGAPERAPALAGTWDYISPEVARGRPLTPAADVYAIGVIGFWLITGAVLFQKLPPLEALGLRTRHDPPDPRAARSDCPEALAGVIRRALARDPSARYATPRELASALAAVPSRRSDPGPSPATRIGRRVAAALRPGSSPPEGEDEDALDGPPGPRNSSAHVEAARFAARVVSGLLGMLAATILLHRLLGP